jgi:hypothetical protein
MKSKEDLARLLAALLGALAGGAVGLGLLLVLFNYVPWLGATGSIAPLLVILALCLGGLVGGGALGLWVVGRRQRTVRKRYFGDRKKQRRRGRA